MDNINLDNMIGKLDNLIAERFIVMAIDTSKSLSRIEQVYKNHIKEIKTIYKEPEKHLSKIMVIAYNKTVSDYNYKGCSQ
jgi:hypothetical protein